MAKSEIHKGATQATVIYNDSQNGIELRFNGDPSEELKSKLRVSNFRPSKITRMWYAEKTKETEAFAKLVVETLPSAVGGPTLNLSPSFEPVKPNVEKRQFSYVIISLSDGQTRSYVLFEPSKPWAEVIATEFAKKKFKDQFIGLVVRPQRNLREARLLFEEGKIIVPENEKNEFSEKEEPLKSTQKSDPLKDREKNLQPIGDQQPTSKKAINPLQPYNTIYKGLLKVIPNLIQHLEQGATSGRSKSGGWMDLVFNYLGKDEDGNYIISLSHYYEQNGDLVPDPDMEIRIMPDLEAAEALSYQDRYRYDEVYIVSDGKKLVSIKTKRALNSFLKQWLSNLIQQGHKVDVDKPEDDQDHGDSSDAHQQSVEGPKAQETDNSSTSDQKLVAESPSAGHSENIEPWMIEQDKFLDYVRDYVNRFGTYPPDVLEMFDVLVRTNSENEKLLNEKRPSHETLEKIVKQVHLLHIYKAIAKDRSLSSSVIAKDYPWLRVNPISKPHKGGNRIGYGFDATDFKTAENFLRMLHIIGASSKFRKCMYLNMPSDAPPVYLWLGKDTRMVTANNPLLMQGYSSSIGLEGDRALILKAVEYIENVTGSKGDEGLEYIDFQNLFCIDPEAPLVLDPGNSPVGGDTTASPTPTSDTSTSSKSASSELSYQKPKHRFSAVSEVDRTLITTRPEMFQGRETDYALETVDKIVREGFDKTQEPIVVWKDDNGRLIVISGHSRWEASRRLYAAGDKSLQTMPVKTYQGTLAEAMDFALLESNRGVTQEGLRSDLRAYKYAKDKGYNREYLKGIFKPESRLKLLEDISHLNESGSFLSYIDTDAEKSFPYLQRNAHWVGQIRKQFPVLSDSHEEEMFRYLYGLNNASKKTAEKKLTVTKGQFFDLMEEKISRIDFHPDKPLNLDQVVGASALTDPAKERIKEIEREIDKLELERHQKDELIARAFTEKKESLVEKFRNRQNEINQIITRKILEKEKIEGEIGLLERTSIDLFSSGDFPRSGNSQQDTKQEEQAEIDSQKFESKIEESKSHPEDYIDRIVAEMHDKYSRSERATKKEIENIGAKFGISDSGRIWEATELSWLLWYKTIYKLPVSFEIRLSQMIQFWNKVQPTYEYSDSSKEIFKQYSTPCPIGAIIAQYTGMVDSKSVFDPSAGNGLLVMSASPSNTFVNEIDNTRIESLKFQGFKSITTYNAAQPFPEQFTKTFDIVVTNPPFTKWDDDQFDKDVMVQKIFDNQFGLNHYLRLEHVMVGIALQCMKDTGKAGIIIMNHVYFDDEGHFARYRPFFNWLFRHYVVDDVINLNSFKLYNKQGAVQRTMLILIDGRKKIPAGVAPNKSEAPHLDEVVDSFEDLWLRVNRHMQLKVYSGDDVLTHAARIGSEHNDSIQLELDREKIKKIKYYKIPLSIALIRDNDLNLDAFINEQGHESYFMPGRKITDPIIIGEVSRSGRLYENGVIDGRFRIAQAVVNGEAFVEAYVPVDSKEYITKYHDGYSIDKVIQQLILSLWI